LHCSETTLGAPSATPNMFLNLSLFTAAMGGMGRIWTVFGGSVSRMLKAKAQRVFPVLILMQSGFRPAGCERICWNDFDWQRKTVRTSEKNLERAIPLSNWASRELAAWKRKHAKHDTHRVYPHHIELAHKELRLLRQAHGLPDSLTFGALRRLTYFRLYKAGVNPQLAARIMGNSVEIAMRHYISLETLNAHKAVRALEPRPQSVPKKRKRKAKKLRQHKAA